MKFEKHAQRQHHAKFSDRKCGIQSAITLRNNDAFKCLQSFPRTFYHSDLDDNGIHPVKIPARLFSAAHFPILQ